MEVNIDKPWLNEPDVVSNEIDDYHVVVFRSHLGQLNGYIGVRRSHPWFGEHHDNKKLRSVHVYGGLTFSGKGHALGGKVFKRKYWYFGFDTAHFGDIVPKMIEVLSSNGMDYGFSGSTYKDINFVQNEVDNLFAQIKEAKEKRPDYVHNFVREYKKLARIKNRKKELRLRLG